MKNESFGNKENFERDSPSHAGKNGSQGINFAWPPFLTEQPAIMVCHGVNQGAYRSKK